MQGLKIMKRSLASFCIGMKIPRRPITGSPLGTKSSKMLQREANTTGLKRIMPGLQASNHNSLGERRSKLENRQRRLQGDLLMRPIRLWNLRTLTPSLYHSLNPLSPGLAALKSRPSITGPRNSSAWLPPQLSSSRTSPAIPDPRTPSRRQGNSKHLCSCQRLPGGRLVRI